MIIRGKKGVITDKEYTLNKNDSNKIYLRNKLPKYDDTYSLEKSLDSYGQTLNDDPIATTNPNLHMIYDEKSVIKRGESDIYRDDPNSNSIFDRKYKFLGLVGRHCYSTVETFVHDEEDTEFSEIP